MKSDQEYMTILNRLVRVHRERVYPLMQALNLQPGMV